MTYRYLLRDREDEEEERRGNKKTQGGKVYKEANVSSLLMVGGCRSDRPMVSICA